MRNLSTIRKCALGFAALFLFVYLLDFVPGIMDKTNGKMFGLFGMTALVDYGHLALGALALISGLAGSKISRVYFCALAVWYAIDVVMYFTKHFDSMPLIKNLAINGPHTLITIAAIWIALKVDRTPTHATAVAS
jgi:hypothetical protein